MYHYTSALFTFTLGKGKSRGNYSGNTNNYNNYNQTTVVSPPYINTNRPTENPYNTIDCRADILADIENINSISGIEVYMNGGRLSSDNYTFNPTSKSFHLDMAFSQNARYTLVAKNSAGAVSKEYNFTCNIPQIPKPDINIYNPTQNPSNAVNCDAGINAWINNIDGINNIEVRQNNQVLNPSLYTYNTSTKAFRLITHINGYTSFTITATNKAGQATASIAFSCQPKLTSDKVTICHIPPGNPTHPVTITLELVR
jgi:hypothetical protein